jgi:hypothetical protein
VSVRDQPLKAGHVDVFRVYHQPIAGRMRFDDRLGQRATQSRYQRLKSVRRPPAPDRPDSVDEVAGETSRLGARANAISSARSRAPAT